jgi:hypothetical protein
MRESSYVQSLGVKQSPFVQFLHSAENLSLKFLNLYEFRKVYKLWQLNASSVFFKSIL